MNVRLYYYAFALMLCLFCALISFYVGVWVARHEIAEAIRAGRLDVLQRVDAVAKQIETGHYRAVGEP